MRYQLRSYGWRNNRPYNNLLCELDNLNVLAKYITQDTYIVDTLTGDIIYDGMVNKEVAQAL